MGDLCPTIRYGIPSDGADEFTTNTGRELFRCGTDCIKMFLTNVNVEKTHVQFSCASITDALVSYDVSGGDTLTLCLQSANANARDRSLVNWVAKENVDSSFDDGTVLTYADKCGPEPNPGEEDTRAMLTFTHVEGQLSFRAQVNIQIFSDSEVLNLVKEMKEVCLAKFEALGACDHLQEPPGDTYADKQIYYNDPTYTGPRMKWIFSDINTNISQTDWQGGGGTFQGISGRIISGYEGEVDGSCSVNFNWNNGQAELRHGCTIYDTFPAVYDIETVIGNLVNDTISPYDPTVQNTGI